MMVLPRSSTARAAKERVKAKERREKKVTTKVAREKAKAKARKEKARMAKETRPPMLLLKPHRTTRAGR